MSDRRDTVRLNRQQLLKSDMQALVKDERFKRFVYCVLMDANVLRGNYGADGRNLPWWEGRRSLGLDILATMQTVDPDALFAILGEEQRTRMENPNGRRSYERNDELGGGDPDGRVRNDGIPFLDYGNEPSGK